MACFRGEVAADLAARHAARRGRRTSRSRSTPARRSPMLAFLSVTGHAHSPPALSRTCCGRTLTPSAQAGALQTHTVQHFARGSARTDSSPTAARSRSCLDRAWFDLLASPARLQRTRTLSIDALRSACELHRGDLMAGFALRDSVEFDDWLRDTQDEVRRERALLLDRLTDALAAAGQADEAVAPRTRASRARRAP